MFLKKAHPQISQRLSEAGLGQRCPVGSGEQLLIPARCLAWAHWGCQRGCLGIWSSHGGQGGFIAAVKPLKVSAERLVCPLTNSWFLGTRLLSLHQDTGFVSCTSVSFHTSGVRAWTDDNLIEQRESQCHCHPWPEKEEDTVPTLPGPGKRYSFVVFWTHVLLKLLKTKPKECCAAHTNVSY